MWKNYIKIALRSLSKNKLHTSILVTGLAIGMAACLLILQYVSFELSFDQFHNNKDNIYRVINNRFQEGQMIQRGTITYPTIGPAMQKDFPEVLRNARIYYNSDMLVRYKDKQIAIEPGLYSNNDFFKIFDFNILAGDRNNLLAATNEVVLTASLARKVFDLVDDNFNAIIGKSIELDNDADPYKITGVCADPPANSLLSFDLMASYPTIVRYFGEQADNSWTFSDFYHYLELEPGTDVAALEAKFAAFSERYFKGSEVSGSQEEFELQPLTDAHLYSSDLEYEIGMTNNGRMVWSLLLIAFFILLIAWINYINLSSIRAIERAKEVGVRKVIGAAKGQLVQQFLTEALVINALSAILAIGLVYTAQPLFNSILETELSMTHLVGGHDAQNYLLFGLMSLLLLGILSSGTYPAWLLSRQDTANVLKGLFQKSKNSAYLRKGLVIFQFTASIALVVGTLLVYQQIQYMSKKDLGVNVEQIIRIAPPTLSNFDSTFIDKVNTFKATLTQYPNITSATMSNRVPGQRMGRFFDLKNINNPAPEPLSSNFINADFSYAETYSLTPVAGRFFEPSDHNTDGALVDKVVLNESAVKLLNFASPEAAIGEPVQFFNKRWTVVGVLPDFHQMSLHTAIEPITFIPYYGTYNAISARILPQDIDRTLAQIQSQYETFFPGNVFAYSFLDERVQSLYQTDLNFGNLLLFFTFLAILIACLGILGLASYTTFLKTKEIGIRKVLGASVVGIVGLLTKDLLKLVLVSAVLAAPLAWYAMNAWLQDFHYRIDIQWWVFVLAGILAISIAFLTVGLQSFKAALSNPVEALKNE